MFSSSLDTVRLHDCFGLPLLLLPWGFHSMAIRVVLFGAFLRVWPIHFHFLRFIVVSTSSCPVRAHNSSFVMTLVWPEDTDYLPEPLIQKGLYLGKQSFG